MGKYQGFGPEFSAGAPQKALPRRAGRCLKARFGFSPSQCRTRQGNPWRSAARSTMRVSARASGRSRDRASGQDSRAHPACAPASLRPDAAGPWSRVRRKRQAQSGRKATGTRGRHPPPCPRQVVRPQAEQPLDCFWDCASARTAVGAPGYFVSSSENVAQAASVWPRPFSDRPSFSRLSVTFELSG